MILVRLKDAVDKVIMVLSFTDFEQVFDFVDRRSLAKVLSLYGIPDKYIKVISAM